MESGDGPQGAEDSQREASSEGPSLSLASQPMAEPNSRVPSSSLAGTDSSSNLHFLQILFAPATSIGQLLNELSS